MTVRNEDARRRIRDGTSRAMKRLAVARQCPMCKRKMALAKVTNDFGHGRVCRWCGHVASWKVDL